MEIMSSYSFVREAFDVNAFKPNYVVFFFFHFISFYFISLAAYNVV